jgi:hypothetical protein
MNPLAPAEPGAALVGPSVEVIYPDGRTVQFPFGTDQVTVGSGPQADISLPGSPELEPLHLLLAPRPDGCWISTSREAALSAKHEGRLFENGVVDWGFELDIGALTFRVSNATKGTHARALRRRRLRKMVMLAAIAVLAMYILREPESAIARTSAKAPALFEGLPDSCETTGAEALTLAHQHLNAADARAERYAFEPNDGVHSVFGFSAAAACFRAVGENDTATWVETEQAKMQQRIEEDYLFHRIRLERALDHERYRDALHEERIVAALVRGQRGEYVTWLTNIDRLLELRAGSRSK